MGPRPLRPRRLDVLNDDPRPEKILLFGSRGQGTPDSDADLPIVMQVDGSKREQTMLTRLPRRDAGERRGGCGVGLV